MLMDYQLGKPTKFHYISVGVIVFIVLILCIWQIYFSIIFMNDKPLFFSILFAFLTIFTMVIKWIYDEYRNSVLNKQLRKELINEIEDNDDIIDKNIDSAKNARKEGRIVYNGLYDQIFNGLVLSNKILIFNEDERRGIFNFYRGVRAVNYNITNILSQPPSRVKDALTDHRHILYKSNLDTVKERIEPLLKKIKQSPEKQNSM